MFNITALEPIARVLAHPVVDRTRRNHGLEHATLNVLAQKHPGVPMVGRSTPNGFYIHGHVSADEIIAAATEALQRLEAGEANLAVHANCGTNYVTAGVAAAFAAYLGFVGANRWRTRWERLPFVALLTTIAIIAAQPVALELQRTVTTSGAPRGLRLANAERKTTGRIVTHFITTEG